MSDDTDEAMQIDVEGTGAVSALLCCPQDASAAFVMAHGAGAGMRHGFMAAVAEGLFQRGIATLRYQFPYMEKATKRPDSPRIAKATVRAAALLATKLMPTLPIFAGGKSFGGRMTSLAQADEPLAGVSGLVFIGFPLHPAKKPGVERAAHLSKMEVPMLFLQGGRDALAEMPLLQSVLQKLGSKAELNAFELADHSFHVPVRSGRKDSDVLNEILDVMSAWMNRASKSNTS